MHSSEYRQLHDEIRVARLKTIIDYPYYGSLLMCLRFVIDERVPSLAAINRHACCFMNPTILNQFLELSRENRLGNLSTLILHESLHCIRLHFSRAETREHHRWNVSADLENNDGIEQIRRFPKEFTPLLPSDFKLPSDLIAESYYERLTDKAIKNIRFVDMGSGVFGQSRDWEIAVGGDCDENAVLSEYEHALIRQTVAQEIREYQTKHGSLPGHALRLADSILGRSKIDWRAKLHTNLIHQINQINNDKCQYLYRRPSRRALVSAPLILPTLTGGYKSKISVIVDTSGSIDQEKIAIAIREISAIGQSMKAEMEIIPCDAVAYEPTSLQTAMSVRQIASKLDGRLIGGGGTDLREGLRAALNLAPFFGKKIDQRRRIPDCLVCLTDGFTPFPEARPSTPILWAVFSDCLTELPSPWKQSDLVTIPC